MLRYTCIVLVLSILYVCLCPNAQLVGHHSRNAFVLHGAKVAKQDRERRQSPIMKFLSQQATWKGKAVPSVECVGRCMEVQYCCFIYSFKKEIVVCINTLFY